MKYLDFYNECMKTGEMPEHGLCQNFDRTPDSLIYDFPTEFEMFYESAPDKGQFWGQEDYDDVGQTKQFNILRQTVVLLCAAMNNEL